MCSPASAPRAHTAASLDAEGFTPVPIIDYDHLHLVAEMDCGLCGQHGLRATAYYNPLPGWIGLGPCRILAACPQCSFAEEC